MTLYYSCVFILLVCEMVSFLLLVAPLPAKVRHQVISFVKNNPIIAQVGLWLRFTFVFILVLFIDSVNRVWRVEEEMQNAKSRAVGGTFGDRDEFLARKFYAQRNMYLCGFTLFLSLILNRTYSLVKELAMVTADASVASTTSSDTKALKEQLRKKDLELEALKKQSTGLSTEYNRVADELNKDAPAVDRKTQ